MKKAFPAKLEAMRADLRARRADARPRARAARGDRAWRQRQEDEAKATRSAALARPSRSSAAGQELQGVHGERSASCRRRARAAQEREEEVAKLVEAVETAQEVDRRSTRPTSRRSRSTSPARRRRRDEKMAEIDAQIADGAQSARGRGGARCGPTCSRGTRPSGCGAGWRWRRCRTAPARAAT